MIACICDRCKNLLQRGEKKTTVTLAGDLTGNVTTELCQGCSNQLSVFLRPQAVNPVVSAEALASHEPPVLGQTTTRVPPQGGSGTAEAKGKKAS